MLVKLVKLVPVQITKYSFLPRRRIAGKRFRTITSVELPIATVSDDFDGQRFTFPHTLIFISAELDDVSHVGILLERLDNLLRCHALNYTLSAAFVRKNETPSNLLFRVSFVAFYLC